MQYIVTVKLVGINIGVTMAIIRSTVRVGEKPPIAPDILESYKVMGAGYTGVMADVLKYALENPDVMAKATR